MKKFSKFREFREQMVASTGLQPDHQVYWGWAKRRNGTYRPKLIYDDEHDEQFVTHLRDEDSPAQPGAWSTHLNLYRQV